MGQSAGPKPGGGCNGTAREERPSYHWTQSAQGVLEAMPGAGGRPLRFRPDYASSEAGKRRQATLQAIEPKPSIRAARRQVAERSFRCPHRLNAFRPKYARGLIICSVK